MNDVAHNAPNVESDEISIRDVFDFLLDLYKEVLAKKYWILASFVVFNLLFCVKYLFLDDIKYTGELKVLLNSNTSSSVLSGIIGGLGLGFAGEDMTAMAKVQTIMQSQAILGRVLMRPTAIRCKNHILANCFLDTLGGVETWKKSKNERLRNFTFFKSPSVDSCTQDEWLALQVVMGNLGEKTVIYKTDDAGILHVSMESGNPQLVCEVLNGIYEETSDYYLSNKLQPGQKTFKALQSRRDSVSAALAGKQYALANFTDRNQGSLFATDLVPIASLQQDIEMLGFMKGEVIKNYEVAKLTVESEQPYLRVLDPPKMPLVANYPSLSKNIQSGTLLGIFLSLSIIIIRHIVKRLLG
jgi:hypothetical protein